MSKITMAVECGFAHNEPAGIRVLDEIRKDLERLKILLKLVEDIDENMAYETGSAGALVELRQIREILEGL